MEPRLQRRYLQMVQEHMKSTNRNAAGPALKPGENQAFSATQAAWRFLSNRNVGLRELVEPLREVGRQAAHQSESEYMLLAHDLCKIDYKTHTSRQDLRQSTHEHDLCYEMSTSMLIDGSGRASIAPMQMDLKTGKAVHSTAIDLPQTLPPEPPEPTVRSFQRTFTPFRFQHVPQNPIRIPRRVK